MFCTRQPGPRSGGVTLVHVFPLSRVTWNGPSFAPVQITPGSSGDSRIAYSVLYILLARHVDRDRPAGAALLVLRLVRREVGRDALPRHALVARAVDVLRAVVDHARIVRASLHRRHALEAEEQVLAGVAVERLRADPVLLLLPAAQRRAAELPLARAVDRVRVRAVRDDRPRLAARALAPRLDRIVGRAAARRQRRHDQRRVVLLRAVEPVRDTGRRPRPGRSRPSAGCTACSRCARRSA